MKVFVVIVYFWITEFSLQARLFSNSESPPHYALLQEAAVPAGKTVATVLLEPLPFVVYRMKVDSISYLESKADSIWIYERVAQVTYLAGVGRGSRSTFA